jgi:hypothetical protein
MPITAMIVLFCIVASLMRRGDSERYSTIGNRFSSTFTLQFSHGQLYDGCKTVLKLKITASRPGSSPWGEQTQEFSTESRRTRLALGITGRLQHITCGRHDSPRRGGVFGILKVLLEAINEPQLSSPGYKGN